MLPFQFVRSVRHLLMMMMAWRVIRREWCHTFLRTKLLVNSSTIAPSPRLLVHSHISSSAAPMPSRSLSKVTMLIFLHVQQINFVQAPYITSFPATFSIQTCLSNERTKIIISSLHLIEFCWFPFFCTFKWTTHFGGAFITFFVSFLFAEYKKKTF